MKRSGDINSIGIRRLLTALLTVVTAMSVVASLPSRAEAESIAAPTLIGPRAGATTIPFRLNNEFSASVDVGTGNLMVTTSERKSVAPGGLMTFGLLYNSLSLSSGSVKQDGYGGRGFYMALGWDCRLLFNSDGSVLFMGLDSQQSLFTPLTATTFTTTSPVNAKLTKVPDGSWQVVYRKERQTLHFTSAGVLQSITDRNGNTTDFGPPTGGSSYTITRIQPGIPTWGISAVITSGRVTMLTTARGANLMGWTSYSYDTAGRLTSTDRQGNIMGSFGWSSAGDLASITDASGTSLAFTYDTGHRVTSIVQGKGSEAATTSFSYVTPTRTDVTAPLGGKTVYSINSTKLVTKVTDALGNSRSATYTPFDNVASTTNGVGGSTTGAFGANAGRSLTQLTLPTGASNSYVYGSSTNPYSVSKATDAQGNGSLMTYDNAGNNTSTAAGASGAMSKVTYNADGTPTSATDPAGATTVFGEDTAAKSIATITPPAGSTNGVTSLSSQPGCSFTNGAGQSTTCSVDNDAFFNPTNISSADSSVTLTYDAAQKVVGREDNNQKTSYAYDTRSNIVTIRTTPKSANAPAGSVVSYMYDLNGNVLSRTVNGAQTRYSYDATNRVITLTGVDGKTSNFSYDNDGRRTDTWWQVSNNRQVFASHAHNDFDASGRVIRAWIAAASSDTNRVFDTAYNYAKDGADTALLQSATNNLASTNNVTSFSYDSQNRLISAGNWGGHTYQYSYDLNGNRTSVTVDGSVIQSRTFDVDNKMTSPGYSYDAAGRRTQDPLGGSLTWNSASQLIRQISSLGTATFMYAGLGSSELIQQTLGTETINYTYGLTNQGRVPTIEQTSKGGVAATHDNDPSGQPIDTVAGGQSNYLMFDGLGRWIGTMSNLGVVTSSMQYDPFGAVISSTATMRASAAVTEASSTLASSGGASPWTTVGIKDAAVPNSGWWKRGARWHDTSTGTWISTDPVVVINNPTRANPYVYAGDNPINFVDFNGLHFWTDAVGGVIGTASAIGCSVGTALAGTILCSAAGLVFGFGITYSLNYVIYGEEVSW